MTEGFKPDEDGKIRLKHKDANNFVSTKPDGMLISSGLPPDGSICMNFYLEGIGVEHETLRAAEGKPGSFEIALEPGDTFPLRENIVRLILNPELAKQVHHLLGEHLEKVKVAATNA